MCFRSSPLVGLGAFALFNLMLGKRSREIVEEASPGKALRVNLIDLYASGNVSGQRLGSLMADGFNANVSACHERFVEKESFRAKTVRTPLAKNSSWPKTYEAKIPIWDNEKGRLVDQTVSFLLPHLVIDCMWSKGLPDMFYDKKGLDEYSRARLLRIERNWRSKLVPFSLWGDGVPYTWDHTDGVDMWSWNLPGQGNPRFKAMRVLITCVPTRMVTRSSHDKMLEVIRWSFQAMALGKHPTTDHEGNQLPHHMCKNAGCDLPFKGVLLEMRGDWKFYNVVLGLPHWRQNNGICWLCKAKTEDIGDCKLSAWWRAPEGRLKPGELLQRLAEQGKALSPIWTFPGPWDSTAFKIDWLHVADIGVTSYFLGGLLNLAAKRPEYGRNKGERCLMIFGQINAWYKAQGQKEDKLHKLDVNMFKGKPPHLKGSAACGRKLVPFIVAFVESWPNHSLTAEMALAKEGMKQLGVCYTSLKPFDARICWWLLLSLG